MLNPTLTPRVCERALAARDPRFDGLFFVGITTTRIYCRPVCPSRLANSSRRRFFDSTGAAELAGFRPCLRCRPELAPGRAPVDAVSRLARIAAARIEAGALNGRSIVDLAAELGVSARHLRRVLEREFGVAPAALARSFRLLLAKRLLTDTPLSVTRIAFTSGFQSLRRFNAVFRQQYRMSPSDLRRSSTAAASRENSDEFLRLTLAYRKPFDWTGLLAHLRRDAVPGVEQIEQGRYARTVALGTHRGIVEVEDAPRARSLSLRVSMPLVPALMPLMPLLRRLFDLDADPKAIESHLSRTGLARVVRRYPGIRLPGSFDPFETVLQCLIRAGSRSDGAAAHLLRRLVWTLGEAASTGIPGLNRFTPAPVRVAEFGASGFRTLGVDQASAERVVAVAERMAAGSLRLEPGAGEEPAFATLTSLGIREGVATRIVSRTLAWPDAFHAEGSDILRVAGMPDESALRTKSEDWRPWRAYAAQLLRRAAEEEAPSHQRATG